MEFLAGPRLRAAPESTLEQLIRERAGEADLVVRMAVDLGGIRLRVKEVSSERAEVVGLTILYCTPSERRE